MGNGKPRVWDCPAASLMSHRSLTPDGFTLSMVAGGRVYGVHRDELGVATARVYRLDRGG